MSFAARKVQAWFCETCGHGPMTTGIDQHCVSCGQRRIYTDDRVEAKNEGGGGVQEARLPKVKLSPAKNPVVSEVFTSASLLGDTQSNIIRPSEERQLVDDVAQAPSSEGTQSDLTRPFEGPKYNGKFPIFCTSDPVLSYLYTCA